MLLWGELYALFVLSNFISQRSPFSVKVFLSDMVKKEKRGLNYPGASLPAFIKRKTYIPASSFRPVCLIICYTKKKNNNNAELQCKMSNLQVLSQRQCGNVFIHMYTSFVHQTDILRY